MDRPEVCDAIGQLQPATAPGIEAYALIGDCHSSALVSRWGSIDWCCEPRFDSPSCFGRLLDWERGGHCTIQPRLTSFQVERRYLPGTLVLETRFKGTEGEVRLLDAFSMRCGGRVTQRRHILRVVEGISGEVPMVCAIEPRFDYARLRPWLRRHGQRLVTAVAGETGLVFSGDLALQVIGRGCAVSNIVVRAGERRRLSVQFAPPHQIHPRAPEPVEPEAIDEELRQTERWWNEWLARRSPPRQDEEDAIVRSAITLKALTYAPTGAIVAAATTSLPEAPGGVRNWDYRYCWIRDSVYALRSLGRLGFAQEAEQFRWFVERTTAGSAEEIRVMYRVDGGFDLTEVELPHLAGHGGARPVRVGNGAYGQLQLDAYGELLDLAWSAWQSGRRFDPEYFDFLAEALALVQGLWNEPDHGIWESRAGKEQFVHSKVLCWAALDRGIRLFEAVGRPGPIDAWREARSAIRRLIEDQGYDRRRGVFVRTLGGRTLDAALLQLPRLGFLDYDDPRMVRTVDAIRHDLDAGGGLVRRYLDADGLPGQEGAFVPACFWVAECLARQGRAEEARDAFARASACGNDVSLYSEELDPERGLLLGNFPQGMSHYAHLGAAWALTHPRPIEERQDGTRSAQPGA